MPQKNRRSTTVLRSPAKSTTTRTYIDFTDEAWKKLMRGGQEFTCSSRLGAQEDPLPRFGTDKADLAAQHGLRVVRGRIPVPDLCIEYATSKHETARLDLELATAHYRFKNIAKRSGQASPSTPALRTCQICAAYWSSGKSLRRF